MAGVVSLRWCELRPEAASAEARRRQAAKQLDYDCIVGQVAGEWWGWTGEWNSGNVRVMTYCRNEFGGRSGVVEWRRISWSVQSGRSRADIESMVLTRDCALRCGVHTLSVLRNPVNGLLVSCILKSVEYRAVPLVA